jgi:hypothetical protein
MADVLIRRAIRCTAGEFRNLRDIGLVFLAPVNNDLVTPLNAC